MILQALVGYYEDLIQQGKVAEQGWGPVKVSYAISLDSEGRPIRLIPMKKETPKGKKTVLSPQEIMVPAPVTRSSGISPNFLCDNSSYILGCDNKGIKETDPAKVKKLEQRAEECFKAAGEHHKAILQEVEHPAAKAIINFFDNWDPKYTRREERFGESMDDLLTNSNIIFEYEGNFVHTIPKIKSAWLDYRKKSNEEEHAICLITGKKANTTRVHPLIKGVIGAQSSGASLVSFNGDAFCSFGKEQGGNAPTGEYASFAYGTALNYLIADRAHNRYLGDTLVLCWANGGQDFYQDMMMRASFEDYYKEEDYLKLLDAIAKGEPFEFENELVDPNTEFYVLGLSPNAARLSVRFFYRNSFGKIMSNILGHHKRLQIVRPDFVKTTSMSIWQIAQETVNQNSRDKKPSPLLTGDLLSSIIANSPYPATLLNGITLRIRADRKVDYRRAAIIKAYYLRNEHKEVPKEVLKVALNNESTNIPYNLGRMFAVLEKIQQEANPGLNSTIKDKYFNSASATPAHIYSTLLNLANSHLKVIGRNNSGYVVYYNKLMTEILGKLPEVFPNRLTLPEQGSFQLGYYHQMQSFYTKKED